VASLHARDMESHAPDEAHFEERLRLIILDHQDALCRLMAEARACSPADCSDVGITVNTEECKDDVSKSMPILPAQQDPNAMQAQHKSKPSHSPASCVTTDVPQDGSNKTTLRMLRSSAGLETGGNLESIEVEIKKYMHDRDDLSRLKGRASKPMHYVMSIWQQLEEPKRSGILSNFIQSTGFEVMVTCVIFANCIYTILATNWEITHIGEPNPLELTIMDKSFLGFYLLELTLRLLVHRWFYFCNADMRWNLFDFSLVVLDLVSEVILLVDGAGVSTSVTFGRALRVLKVSRVLRFVRVVQALTELSLMLSCLLNSIVSLVWSLLLLGLIQLLFAIAFVQQTAQFLNSPNPKVTEDIRVLLLANFGSIQQGVLSLYMAVSGNDWAPYYDMLKRVGVFSAGLFLFYVSFMWLAVTNVITSVFVDKALKAAKPEVEYQMLEACSGELQMIEELKSIFKAMDSDNSNYLSLDEIRAAMDKVSIREFFAMRGLAATHADMLFRLLSSMSPSDKLDIETFVTGCVRMKGYATNIDVISLSYRTTVLANDIRNHIEEYRRDILDLRAILKEASNKNETYTGQPRQQQQHLHDDWDGLHSQNDDLETF